MITSTRRWPMSISRPFTCAPPTMQPATASARAPEPDLLQAYLAWLRASGRSVQNYVASARRFFARWPHPQTWACESLHVRLTTTTGEQLALLNFLLYLG